MSTGVGYVGFSRSDLDREYSPSSAVPNLEFYLREYAELSTAARDKHNPLTDLSYGSAPQARLDLFPVTGDNSALVVFVHGGYWQEVTKEESAFAAPDFNAAGIAFAALDYGLAPAYSLDEIVTMVGDAVAWLHTNATQFGVDPQRIYLAGSCAGAHLVAMALIQDDARRIAGATLLSGIYDLEPLRHTYVNDALGLDIDAALRNSPSYHLPKRLPPVVIARGGGETQEFIRQHDTMTVLLRQRTAVTELTCPARNHFDLPYDLGNPDTELGLAVLAQIQGPRASGSTPYTAYAHIDTLLSLQHPQTSADTEPGFIILSQVKELLFELLHTEFSTARDYLAADRPSDALWTLRRAGRVQQLLLSCWDALGALSPGEFASFRDVLGPASGFQSFTYRRLEFLLGNKNPHLARPHRSTARYPELLAELRRPSLYDEAVRYLARRGLDIPLEVADRDFSLPYQPDATVAAAWRQVYEQPSQHHELFLLAEALMDSATLFARWRYAHLLTVQRLLGDKPGTGGTEGSGWLGKIAEHRFFPELWSIRSIM